MRYAALIFAFLMIVPRGTKANDSYGNQYVVSSSNGVLTGTGIAMAGVVPFGYKVELASVINTGTGPLYIACVTGTSGPTASGTYYDFIAYPGVSGTYMPVTVLCPQNGLSLATTGTWSAHYSVLYGP